ncbi:arsenite efflux transporter metallochaperone ArsD [Tuwongella immobilis]|uniref:Arsenical resistance operon trans-acting repressor ArsD n=1 Tax=Tuwongella immobilis TaxID=692036 RepID=A0A6C2YRI1_9BACT|nr:arsenite efflux transporter metallochaperone ArsD [Tuwongella immobilis]VIP03482.1 arsenical resistance operon trans-acting repressor : Arsenical resistance operon trans-acting repressor ArsD OS=Planctomyces limnophilus (strain ATCC 43296 / DSM 3776 / IFAM 1008 / 290) GN=Plim_0147 PE=4 SV=1: ArsD [Tuwongella immobilis]VTS04334.1 arsenical resistance operon trans-acting repressor : Arsenical resistance operon trans-acting repressor ArsD OS=Planctomyces limnophilus (strain ATCC 43296 / DSM 3776 
MTTLQIYDRALCCSTGVCGPEVDPILPQFAADLQWLASRGVQVERYNLAQQPQAFVANPMVQQRLQQDGTDCLPLVVVDGTICHAGSYPNRSQLQEWTGVKFLTSSLSIVSESHS